MYNITIDICQRFLIPHLLSLLFRHFAVLKIAANQISGCMGSLKMQSYSIASLDALEDLSIEYSDAMIFLLCCAMMLVGHMNNKKVHKLILLSVFLLLITENAFANAGTPLMLASALHLVVGNAFIGIIEGLLIAIVFGVKKKRSISIMILANYVSMIAGSVIIVVAGDFFNRQVTIYSIHLLLICLLLGSFVLTILIEWPFCIWIFKSNDVIKKKSLRASVYAQALSYALLIPFYFLASGTSLLWNVKPDRSLPFVKSNPWVYYISTDHTKISRVRVIGEYPEKVADVRINSDYARLFAKQSNVAGQWDLWVKDRFENKKDEQKILIKNFATRTELLRRFDGKVYDEEPDSWFNCGVVDFRVPDKRDWEARTGFWAIEGFQAENKKTGQKIHLALETPFVQWYMRNVSILPDNQVIFQMGSQIVIFDLKTHAGLLAIIAGAGKNSRADWIQIKNHCGLLTFQIIILKMPSMGQIDFPLSK
jgi:hypothetical protein